MLTESEICHCERKSFKIVRSSKTRKEAKKRLRAFVYKGVQLSNKRCDNIINCYVSEFGKNAFKK